MGGKSHKEDDGRVEFSPYSPCFNRHTVQVASVLKSQVAGRLVGDFDEQSRTNPHHAKVEPILPAPLSRKLYEVYGLIPELREVVFVLCEKRRSAENDDEKYEKDALKHGNHLYGLDESQLLKGRA